MENDCPICYLCQGPTTHRLYASLPKIWICKKCGLVFHYPQPELDFLKEHYGKGYFISRSSVAVGYDNYLRDEEYAEKADAAFDMVTVWDVFEHLRDPRKDLCKIHRLLKRGGCLVMTTPAIDSLPHFLFRERWMGFKEEEHLFFFSKKTMNSLLAQCGFKVRFMKFEGKYVSLDLLKRRIGCYWKGLSEYLRRSFPTRWGRSNNLYINPMDIRLVIAQKI